MSVGSEVPLGNDVDGGSVSDCDDGIGSPWVTKAMRAFFLARIFWRRNSAFSAAVSSAIGGFGWRLTVVLAYVRTWRVSAVWAEMEEVNRQECGTAFFKHRKSESLAATRRRHLIDQERRRLGHRIQKFYVTECS